LFEGLLVYFLVENIKYGIC